MTEFLWAVVISACIAVFATFVVMIVILMVFRSRTSIWTDIIVTLIAAAVLGSSLLTVDALVVLGIVQRWRDRRAPVWDR